MPARATASRDLARARVGVAVVFFAYGAVFGTWAARVPAIRAELGLGDGKLGTALLAMAAGTFAGARLGGWPTDRFGARATSTAGVALLSAALAGPRSRATSQGSRSPWRRSASPAGCSMWR